MRHSRPQDSKVRAQPYIHPMPKLSIAALLLWMLLCAATYAFAREDLVFEFSYFVLPCSALAVPLCVAHICDRLFCKISERLQNERPTFFTALAAALIGVSAYVLSAIVLGRFLELPWRLGKFGETSFSLGRGAAERYSMLAVLVVACAFLLYRTAPNGSKAARYAVGSIGMVAFSSSVYLIIGLSPLVEWKA